jgi:hypothetical protein
VKRVLRILLGTAAVLSLGMCLAMAWLWVRSSSRSDELTSTWTTVDQVAKGWTQISPRRFSFWSMDGRCMIRWDRYWMTVDDDQAVNLGRQSARNLPHAWDLDHKWYFWVRIPGVRARMPPAFQSYGFYWYRGQQLRPKDPNTWTFAFPDAVAVLFFSILPGWVGFEMFRRRARAGLCTSCGYDLRATPQRCPECGAVPQPGHTVNLHAPSP